MILHDKSSVVRARARMITLAAAFAVLVGILALPVRADCTLPPPPSKVPDGSTASQQEMITAMQTLKEYDGDVDVYLKCLEFETKQNRMAESVRGMKHDAAVAQLQNVADKFNQQVRVYKSKHG
jgi:hypothetical protein